MIIVHSCYFLIVLRAFVWLWLLGKVCHIMFLVSLKYTTCMEIVGVPPVGTTELPTCHIYFGEFASSRTIVTYRLRPIDILSYSIKI